MSIQLLDILHEHPFMQGSVGSLSASDTVTCFVEPFTERLWLKNTYL